jgi:prolyl 4-hydroxylase
MKDGKNVHVYDPFESGDLSLDVLSFKDRNKYDMQKKNIDFGEIYQGFTGREWLGLWPTRKVPMYKMWNADYFGQQHWVTSKETHFLHLPPEDQVKRLDFNALHTILTDEDPRALEEYRSSTPLNMTVTVLSCAPRVFEIKNFLSHVEVDHIVHMATGMKLSLSTTSADGNGHHARNRDTRTSQNSWVSRSTSPIIDSIYRRASDVMRIDEAFLRSRDKSERPEVDHFGTNAEDLQLVHYGVGQRYTAHHDFGYPSMQDKDQPSRFATLLLYLNEGMEGGETSFPRWLNAEDRSPLNVIPEIGKAVLFYDVLPDGNLDDLSQRKY